MSIHSLLSLFISSMLINNIVLSLMIGVCPLFGVSRRLSEASGLGLVMIIVMCITTILTWIINLYILVPLDLLYLQTIVFVLIIVSLVQVAEMAMFKLWPVVHESFGIYLPIVGTNCAILAVNIMSSQKDLQTGNYPNLIHAVTNSLASGTGFLVAIVLMAGISKKLDLLAIPKPFKGLPITFLSLGLMSLAFLGFSGISIAVLFGG